jgi:hypothetical protein
VPPGKITEGALVDPNVELHPLLQLIPITVIALPLAWGNYYLAAKSGRRGWLFVLLTLIPVVGIAITYYLLYSTIIYALNRLPSNTVGRPPVT